MSNLQEKTQKLIKYGNTKFSLNETTVRGILDNIVVGGEENLSTELDAQDGLLDRLEDTINAFPDLPDPYEWQPNPTWWDIEKILEEDTRDYKYKVISLIFSYGDVEQVLQATGASAYATSDGKFYELSTTGESITHTWDLTKDRPCIVDGVRQYDTRYIIVYGSSSNVSFYKVSKNSTIYSVANDLSAGHTYLYQDQYYLQCVVNPTKIMQYYGAFNKCYSLKSVRIDTSACKSFNEMFKDCYSLEIGPDLEASNCTTTAAMFSGCYELTKTPSYNTVKCTTFNQMFSGCYKLIEVSSIDTSSGTSFSSMFSSCRKLVSPPYLNTSNGTNFMSMFYGCYELTGTPLYDTSNGTNFNGMFSNCTKLINAPLYDTRNGTNFGSMFYGCSNLQTVKLDLINATSVSSIFNYCPALRNLILKNIKISITIGSGTSYGHLLTLDSLLNIIKELHDNTSGSSTLTLTVGSANLEKLANVYVKLIDITDEMRAEDEYIDNKKPFVVCESTDEGAMLVTEYVTTVKNWQLA